MLESRRLPDCVVVPEHRLNDSGFPTMWDREEKKMVLAHRYALEKRLGRRIRRGYVARHTVCCYRPCENGHHLTEGTRAQNNKDTARAGRVRNQHLPRLTDTHDRRKVRRKNR